MTKMVLINNLNGKPVYEYDVRSSKVEIPDHKLSEIFNETGIVLPPDFKGESGSLQGITVVKPGDEGFHEAFRCYYYVYKMNKEEFSWKTV